MQKTALWVRLVLPLVPLWIAAWDRGRLQPCLKPHPVGGCPPTHGSSPGVTLEKWSRQLGSRVRRVRRVVRTTHRDAGQSSLGGWHSSRAIHPGDSVHCADATSAATCGFLPLARGRNCLPQAPRAHPPWGLWRPFLCPWQPVVTSAAPGHGQRWHWRIQSTQ